MNALLNDIKKACPMLGMPYVILSVKAWLFLLLAHLVAPVRLRISPMRRKIGSNGIYLFIQNLY